MSDIALSNLIFVGQSVFIFLVCLVYMLELHEHLESGGEGVVSILILFVIYCISLSFRVQDYYEDRAYFEERFLLVDNIFFGFRFLQVSEYRGADSFWRS